MADLSQVQLLDGSLYDLKDELARSRMIDNTDNSDVSAIVNFVNGLKIKGNAVISSATADIEEIGSDEKARVDLTISAEGVANFSFKWPKAEYIVPTSFVEHTLAFNKDKIVSFDNTTMVLTKDEAAFLGDSTILIG